MNIQDLLKNNSVTGNMLNAKQIKLAKERARSQDHALAYKIKFGLWAIIGTSGIAYLINSSLGSSSSKQAKPSPKTPPTSYCGSSTDSDLYTTSDQDSQIEQKPVQPQRALTHDCLGGLRKDHVSHYDEQGQFNPAAHMRVPVSQIVDEILEARKSGGNTKFLKQLQDDAHFSGSANPESIMPVPAHYCQHDGVTEEQLGKDVWNLTIDMRPFKDLSVSSINQLTPEKQRSLTAKAIKSVLHPCLTFNMSIGGDLLSPAEELIAELIKLHTYIAMGARAMTDAIAEQLDNVK